MGKQKNLFDLFGNQKLKTNKNSQEKDLTRISTSPIKSQMVEKQLGGQVRTINRNKPKIEFYNCECGLIMHWTVAEGRRDGCPACGRSIPLSKIFSSTQ